MAWRRLRRALLGLAASSVLCVGPALAEPSLWKISDADSHVWLFGSIHILDGERPWRSANFDAALNESDLVYFELVLDAQAYSEMTRLTFTEGLFPKGKSLDDVLSGEQRERLSDLLATHGLDYADLRRMRPWLADMTLMQQIGLGMNMGTTTAGVEVLIADEIDDARERGFETPRFQLGLFIDRPVEEQVESLMATAEALNQQAADPLALLNQMVGYWMSGDNEALHGFIAAEFGGIDSPVYQQIIENRNRTWTGQIARLLADNESAMIIVGAGHLVGPVAVQALLEEQGYTVTLESAPPRGDARDVVRPR